MTEQSRSDLQNIFHNGARPDQQQFAHLFDSFLNFLDDGLRVENAERDLILPGGLALQDSNRAEVGTLRLNGANVQFHDGNDWVNLGSGGGVFQQIGGGNDVGYADGNVGIGDPFDETAPTHRLEVELGANTGEEGRARFGNVVCSNADDGTDAYVYHRDQDPGTGYALRQRDGGEVRLNAPSGQRIRLTQDDDSTSRIGVTRDGNVVVNSANNIAAGSVFQVNGQAFKNTPGDAAWDEPSDARLKDDVRDLELGLAEVLKVRPVRFRTNGKAGTPEGSEKIGIIGQEIEQVIPEMVRRAPVRLEEGSDPVDLRIYNASALTYVLVNAVKELAARVTTLETRLDGGGSENGDG